MVGSNTETGISVSYEDGDNTLDFVIGAGAIVNSMLADDAVGADELAANSVVSASIVNGSIVSADIAANTIATSNIADNAVDATKIASNSILTRHIDDNQITGDQLADDLALSGTGSIRLPDGTTAQRPGSAAAGMLRYNTSLGQFEGYTSSWVPIDGGTSAFSTNTMTGDGSDTTLTLSQAPDSESDVIVFIDGVFQAHDTYAVSGTTLTFSTAPASGRIVTAYHVKAAVSGTNLTHDAFSGDGSDTTFTLSIAPVHENNTQVYVDGVYQFKGTYSVSGTTLTFSTAPPNGTSIEVMTMNQLDINVPVDDTITTAKIADNAITSAKIASGVVITGDVADNSITSAKIVNGTIATADLADNSITAAKIPNATALTLDGGVTIDNITIDGTEIDLSSGDLTIDAAGRIDLSADDNGEVRLFDGSSQYGQFKDDSDRLTIQGTISDADMLFVVNDGGTATTAMKIDAADGGDLRTYGKVGIGGDPDASLHNTPSAVTNVHYDTSAATILEATENVLQVTAADSGSNATALLLSNAPSSGDNKHWIFHHGGTSKSNRLDIGYGTSTGTGFDGRGDIGSDLTILTNGAVIINGTSAEVAGSCTWSIGARNPVQCFNASAYVQNSEFMTFRNQGTQIGSIIMSNTNATTYGTSSDYRLKENVSDMTGATAKLKQLKPKRFNWIADTTNTLQDGFLAHEVSPVVPEAIIGDKDAKDSDDNPIYQQIDHSKLIPLLVKTIQELEARITTLEG